MLVGQLQGREGTMLLLGVGSGVALMVAVASAPAVASVPAVAFAEAIAAGTEGKWGRHGLLDSPEIVVAVGSP